MPEENYSAPYQIKAFYVSGTKIYRNILTFTFQVLQKSSSWACTNGAVQMFFLTATRNMFWLCCGSIVFIMLSELRNIKWVRFFKRNCIVKVKIFFLVFVGFDTFYQINSNMSFLIIYFLVQILFFGTVLILANVI